LPPICHEKGEGVAHGATRNIDRLELQKYLNKKIGISSVKPQTLN
jgi:hypothetical protein